MRKVSIFFGIIGKFVLLHSGSTVTNVIIVRLVLLVNIASGISCHKELGENS